MDLWSMFRPFHHILKSTRNDMRYIQRYRMRTCSFSRATRKFHWKVKSVFTQHSLRQQPQQSTTFPQGGDFSNNAFNLFHFATIFGKAPSSFLTERKENITFGKYSFSLHFLYCHFCFFLLPGCSLSFAHYFTFGFQPCFEVTQTLW